ncbi:MAG TPA: response regulator transcription factor [Acidimicrobiia bacterium]|nr:response regulator transcription factor [Acidimicrobiia bacterium]
MRVMLAEDSVLFRQGLARLLEDGGVEIIAAVDDAEALIRRIRADQPDVAIVDIRMPPTHTTEGIQAAIEIRSAFPDVGVLVLSQHVETEYAVELLRDTRGRVGYLLKDRVTDPGEILDALRRICEGETVVDSDLVARLLGRRRESSPLDSLTRRERDVLAAMAEGRTNQGIAEALFMSPKTVETHTRSIFQKLDLLSGDDYHRRVVAAVTWLREQ